MEYRRLGKTGRDVSVIGFGAWAIGGSTGAPWTTPTACGPSTRRPMPASPSSTPPTSTATGGSERVIRRFLRERRGRVVLRRHQDGPARARWTGRATRRRRSAAWVDRSRENLGVETPGPRPAPLPADATIYYTPGALRGARRAGGRRARSPPTASAWRRSRRRLKAIEFPGVATVQIIFNMFRQRPADRFLAEAARRDVGVLARVPLASGPAHRQAHGAPRRSSRDDHRLFNRHGESFDVGETFAGVDYETGLEVVEELTAARPGGRHAGPDWPCAGSSCTTASRPRSRAPRRPSRRGPTPPPRTWRRSRRRPWPAIARALRDPDQAAGPPALVGDTDMPDIATYRVPGAILTEREHTVPLDHASPDGRSITVFTREVADPDGLDRPYLVFLQGGPGLRGDAAHQPAVGLDEARAAPSTGSCSSTSAAPGAPRRWGSTSPVTRRRTRRRTWPTSAPTRSSATASGSGASWASTAGRCWARASAGSRRSRTCRSLPRAWRPR